MSIKFNILVKYLTFKFKFFEYNGILDSTSGGELVKREELKEQNRTQIIEAAKRLFLAQGIQKTSVRQISQESGISYVTMYKYFADKEALVQEVLTGLIDTSFADAQATIKNSSQPFLQRLQAIPNTSSLGAITSQASYEELSKTIETTPKLRAHVRAKLDGLFTTFIQIGRRDGFITTPASDEAIITILTSLVYYGDANGHEPDPKQTEGIVNVLLYGLTGK
ncbi:TetR/AcrR family transcriptional regulator [Limosilactobacillus fermentum]|nr:TetR/AcrR family transcriptional regulator [Limosilactobacillus fermentum]